MSANAELNAPVVPGEWEPHRACWVAWPWDASLWEDLLPTVQATWVELCAAISDVDAPAGERRGEALEVLVPGPVQESMARRALRQRDIEARFHQIPYGDIWMRDIAPIFVHRGDRVEAASFAFNGWGEKYILEGDADVSQAVARTCGLPFERHDWVLEGGSVELDGRGTCLTTEQCLLNVNRNPALDLTGIEARLAASLGVRKTIWLGDGLLNDHTDGHIDTIARFVGPSKVLAMEPAAEDPNRSSLEAIIDTLTASTDADGRSIDVVTVPSPGTVLDRIGTLMPASYVNFYIANGTVAVPVYGVPNDDIACEGIAALFPGRRIVPIPARELLEGGGAFHCITQQEPLP